MFIVSANVTGETAFYSFQSKDEKAFPCNYKEDAFSEYCLDAPNSILTGTVTLGYRAILAESFPRDWTGEEIRDFKAKQSNTPF